MYKEKILELLDRATEQQLRRIYYFIKGYITKD